MKNTFIALVFTIIIPCTTAIAQKPTKAFIITLENDTLQGYVLDRIDAKLSISVEFSKEINGEKKSYSPSELEGFGFHTGRVFKKIAYSDNSGNSQHVFAKKVLQGKVDVFTRRKLDRDQPDFFLVNNSLHRETLLVPPSKELIEDKDGRKFRSGEFKHLGLLNYIKGDADVASEKKKRRIQYNERDILKDISEYNNSHAATFPTIAYQEQQDFSYDITAGLPIAHNDQEVYFRVAVYRNKTFPEKSRTISFMRGISYRYWQSTKEPELEIETSNQNYRQQFLGIMPIGVHFHSAKGVVRPYIYCAAGLSILISTDYHVVDYVDKGSRTTVFPFPAINVGTGIRIKVASKFLVAELTPTLGDTGLFMNIGYSF